MRLLSILFFISLISCAEKRAEMNEMAYSEVADVSSKSLMNQESSPQPQQGVTVIERKLIRNGRMVIEIKDAEETHLAIEKLCKEFNAYLSSEHQSKYGDRIQFTAEIRVQASRFDELIKRLEDLSITVEDKSIDTQDVTEEFIDVEARLKTKKELEIRYLEILTQAKSVTDILSIEGQLNAVRAEIESMQGRLNYLKNQVAFSTLDLTYYQYTRTDFGFFSKVGKSLANGWDNLLLFIVGVLQVWPFVLMGAVAVYFFIRYRRRKQSMK